MGLSFQEKSLWLMLVGLVGAFGFYFTMALPHAAVNVQPAQVALFVVAVVFLVVGQVVGQVVVAILDRRTGTDERDRMVGLVATRNAAYVLASGVFLSLCVAVIMPGNFAFTHVLLGSWVLAQLVEIGSQLVLYRRGV